METACIRSVCMHWEARSIYPIKDSCIFFAQIYTDELTTHCMISSPCSGSSPASTKQCAFYCIPHSHMDRRGQQWCLSNPYCFVCHVNSLNFWISKPAHPSTSSTHRLLCLALLLVPSALPNIRVFINLRICCLSF